MNRLRCGGVDRFSLAIASAKISSLQRHIVSQIGHASSVRLLVGINEIGAAVSVCR